MNNLKVFVNDQLGNIRVIDQNGNPYFVLKDVCDVLEISEIRQNRFGSIKLKADNRNWGGV